MTISKFILLSLFLWMTASSVWGREIRSLWVMPWNLADSTMIDELIADALENNQTEILAEVRYRSDAMHVPNKHNSHYNNPEPRSYILKDFDFDPLEYLLNEAHGRGIAVQAWLSVLNATQTNTERLRTNYIYQNHQDWIMTDSRGRRMNGINYMGNFIDPGILEVKNHLLNVMLDIVANYPTLDGIHLDYIRYPSAQYGHSGESVRRFREAEKKSSITWNDWRMAQVTDLVREFRERALAINPELLITAAVMADIREAKSSYAQDWVNWVNTGLIDRVYPMAYAKDYGVFYNVVHAIAEVVPKEKVVVGIRAWQENFPRLDYSLERIIEKAKLCRQMNFGGLALFSYEGLRQTGMFPKLTLALYDWQGMDFDASSEDSFITRLTSRYRYANDLDSLEVLPFGKIIRSVELQETTSKQDKSTKPLAYFDNIILRGDIYYLTFYFEREKKWKWEITDVNNNVLFKKSHVYPRGYYTEEWNGSSSEGDIIQNGIYTLRVKDASNKVMNEKKFIVY